MANMTVQKSKNQSFKTIIDTFSSVVCNDTGQIKLTSLFKHNTMAKSQVLRLGSHSNK